MSKKSMNFLDNKETTETCSVFITSWNMGNAEPDGMRHIFNEKDANSKFDLIVIGLQESTYNFKQSTEKAQDCIIHLGEIISKVLGSDYTLVNHCYRAQLQLYVFAKKSIKPRISNVEQSIENTGFLHVFPNKGGLLVTLQIDGTKFAFISCHLTAHEGIKHCEQRNQSIVEILGGVRAGDKRLDVTGQFHHVFWMGDMNYRLTWEKDHPKTVKKNVPLFTGIPLDQNLIHVNLEELNSPGVRKIDSDNQMLSNSSTHSLAEGSEEMDSELDSDSDSGLNNEEFDGKKSKSSRQKKEWLHYRRKCLEMIVKEQWSEMLNFDELNREIRAGRVLNLFFALTPSFPPTFKRTRALIIKESEDPSRGWVLKSENQSNISDDMVSNFYHPKRMPSFTDRILFRSTPTFAGSVKPIFFDSCEAAVSSDHKPVRAGFEVNISPGAKGIMIDRNIMKWKGKISRKTSLLRSDVNMLRLRVNNLKGMDLEEMDAAMFGGGSDPYVIVTTDPPQLQLYKGTFAHEFEGERSSVIKHQLNPVWKEELIIALASIDLQGLCNNASLVFSVWDEDLLNPDDIIGHCHIPMVTIIQHFADGNSDFEFNEFLHCNSEIMGRLSGTISLDQTFEELRQKYEEMLAAKENHDNNFIDLETALSEPVSMQNCCTMT